MKSENHANVIEVLGRNHLIAQLIGDEVHAAIPLWDRGIDLIAYFSDAQRTHARPLQLKANEDARWGLHRKYEIIPDLLMVYVWYVRSSDPEIYAMTYKEAFTILEERGHTQTVSWTKVNGGYTIPGVNADLKSSLMKFRMTKDTWRQRLMRFDTIQ